MWLNLAGQNVPIRKSWAIGATGETWAEIPIAGYKGKKRKPAGKDEDSRLRSIFPPYLLPLFWGCCSRPDGRRGRSFSLLLFLFMYFLGFCKYFLSWYKWTFLLSFWNWIALLLTFVAFEFEMNLKLWFTDAKKDVFITMDRS